MPELPWLTATLRDFLFLPEDLDLPALHAVTLTADRNSRDWTARAQLAAAGHSAQEIYKRLTQWAAGTGARVQLGERYADRTKPSGFYRSAYVEISHVGIAVTVWAHLDAQAALDLTEHERPTVQLPEAECLDERMATS